MLAARLLAFAFLVAVVGLAIVCAGRNTPPDEATPVPPADHTGPPLTDGDYRAFGKELEKAVAAGDVTTATRLFRQAELLDRIVADLGFPAHLRQAGLDAATAQMGTTGVAAALIRDVAGGATYKVLRVHRPDGRLRLIVRLIAKDGSVVYHEFALTRYPDGAIGVEEMDNLSAGEPLSSIGRRPALRYAAELPEASERLTDADRAYLQHADGLAALAGHLGAGRFRDALVSYQRLPDRLRAERVVRLQGLAALGEAGGEADYLAELSRFRADYPDDLAADLHAVGYLLTRDRIEDSLDALARVNRRVGGDPYLTWLRASILNRAGRLPEAAEAAEQAVVAEPGLKQAYWERVITALKQRKHADAAAWLKKLVENTRASVSPGMMRTNPLYVDFVRSPEFAELEKWLAGQKKD